MITKKEQVKHAKAMAEAHPEIFFHESASGAWHVSYREPGISISYWPVGAFRSQLHGKQQRPEAAMSVYTENINEASRKRRDRERAVLVMLPDAPTFEQVLQAILDVAAGNSNYRPDRPEQQPDVGPV